MKVMFVNNYGKMIGGAEKYLLGIITNLEAQGIETLLFATDLRPKKADLVERTYSAATSYNPAYRIYNPKVRKEFRRALKEFSPDIVHANQTLNILSPSWMRGLELPLVATVHDHQIACPRTFRFHKNRAKACSHLFRKSCLRSGCVSFLEYEYHRMRLKAARNLFKNVDRFIAPSEYMANVLRRTGFENVHVIPNPIDMSGWVRGDGISKREEGWENIILCVGKFLKMKGFDVVIRALPKVLEKVPSAKLHFIGAGKGRAELEETIRKTGCQDAVEFIGWVPNEDMIKYYRGAKVVVVPSVFPENCSMVILEALASGTPVIATKLGGNPEIIRNETMGTLVKPNDPQGLAHAVVQYLQRNHDDRSGSSKKWGLLPPKYRMGHYIKELVSLYGDVIASRGHGPPAGKEMEDDVGIPRFKYDREGAFCLSVDFELMWAWRYARSYPETDMGKLARENLPEILRCFIQHRIPVTWFTIGHLFLKSCSREVRGEGKDVLIAHPDMPRPMGHYENAYWRWYGDDWYELDPCTNHDDAPSWYAWDMIQEILDVGRDEGIDFEFACHSFSHVDLSDAHCDPDLAREEIEACSDAMAPFGLKPFSIAFPGNIGGNFKALAESGIRAYRGPTGKPSLPYKMRLGMWNVPQTLFLSPKMGTPKKAIDQIRYAMENNTLCHMTMHPSEMDGPKVEGVLDPVLEFASKMDGSGRLWIASVQEIATYFEARDAVKAKLLDMSRTGENMKRDEGPLKDEMHITISVDDSFDPDAFPKAEVTFKVKIPRGMRPVSVLVNGSEKVMGKKDCEVHSKRDGTFLILTTPPENGTIRIKLQK